MLKIKDNVDLKELEKFGFEKIVRTEKTHNYQFKNGIEDYYTEKVYILDDGCNVIEILEERNNSDWCHSNVEKQIYIYESDYEMGVSLRQLDKMFDLIQAGLVEKIEE